MLKTKAGDVFGSLTVVSFEGGKPSALGKAEFLCACGKQKSIRLGHVTSGRTVSCGCAKRKNFVEVGQVFARLTVLSDIPVAYGVHLKVPCRCSCGVEKMIGIADLFSGGTKSCGCFSTDHLRAFSTKHGSEGTPLYSVWSGIKNRCLNPGTDGFHCYGGRGISICPEWLNDFTQFKTWALVSGYRDDLQIDRADVNGDYTPSNCRWVTSKVNGNNRRNNVLLTAFGETKTMSEWADDPICAVMYSTLRQRIYKSRWPHEKSITEPSRRR